ncbi:MAG: TIGR03067 domain-containing protein [Planctomycetes bacterium]|nr:TIGR03067 domain-containing protein [Planctomycetota bacterium]
MAIVSCPECGKKLKVADMSIGKKVKGPCGHVFVAEAEAAAPAKAAAPAAASDKVMVACTECGAKLKVAGTSLGKKMKCPKCTGVFVARADEPAPPVKKAAPPAEPELDEDDAPRPKGKPKAVNDDDMEDLFGFAEKDAARAPEDDNLFTDEDEVKPKGKAKAAPKWQADEEEEDPRAQAQAAMGWSADDDDEPKKKGKAGKKAAAFDDDDEPKPKSKYAAKKAGKAARDDDEDEDEDADAKPVYPRRRLLNVFVLLLLIGYITFFSLMFLRVLPDLGLGTDKPDDKKIIVTQDDDGVAARQKDEKEWLAKLKAKEPKEPKGVVVHLEKHAPAVAGLAFAPVKPSVASVALANEKEGVKIWDLETQKAVLTIPVKVTDDWPMLQFSPAGDFLALASPADKMLKVWNVADGKEALSVALEKPPGTLAFSTDGKNLMVVIGGAGYGGADVAVWTVAGWKKEKTFNAETTPNVDYLLAPHGSRLVEINGAAIKVMEIRAFQMGVPAMSVKNEKSYKVSGAAVSPDGKYLGFTAPGADGAIKVVVLNVDSGDTTVLAEEKLAILRVQFTPDSKYLAYATHVGDGQFHLYDIATKKKQTFEPGLSRALAFSPGQVFVARAAGDAIQVTAFDELLSGATKIEDKSSPKVTPPDNKAEAAKLEGTWIVESVESEGKAAGPAKMDKLTFADGKVNGPDIKDAPYTVDAGKEPHWLDVALDADRTLRGIYNLEGDTLRWCVADLDPKSTRPKAFDKKDGLQIVLKRAKKDTTETKKDSLDGAWIVESAVDSGKPDDKMKGTKLTFAGGVLKGLIPVDVPYKLNAGKDPAWIDLAVPAGPDKTDNVPGIFKIDGDKLWVCLPGGPTAPRPKSFDEKETSLLVLRRAGKTDTAPPKAPSDINLKIIALGIHEFADANKPTNRLPPAASSKKGDLEYKPLLSWRVAILPYINEKDLFKEFDLDKPWDDPHNMKLIAKMPKVYMVPGIDAKEGMTHYRTLVGPGTLLEPIKSGFSPIGLTTKYKLNTVPDGTANVIMVAEAAEPTIWTKPDDLPYDPKGALPKFGVVPLGFNVVLADGSVQFVPAKVPEAVLRPWLTCDNNKPREPLAPQKGGGDEGGKGDKKGGSVEKKHLKEDFEADVARAQIKVLTLAVNAYAFKNNSKFPESLEFLLKKDATGAGPYLENKDTLLDPWKQLYQYDPTGPQNQGKQPDIWTLVPRKKQAIGNWPEVDNAKEAAKFDGTWVLRDYDFMGVANPDLLGAKYVFANGKLTTRHPPMTDWPFRVDAGRDPMEITVVSPPGGKKAELLGVYKLDGDTLQICFGSLNGGRPAKVDAKLGELFTLKREKKAEPKEPEKGKVKAPPLASVKGTVNVDGKPLADGEIWFIQPGQSARKITIKDGVYTGMAQPGRNRVEIHSYRDGPPSATDPKTLAKVETIQAKYNAQSVLMAEVAAETGNELNFEIALK